MALGKNKPVRITVNPKNLGTKFHAFQYNDIPNFTDQLFERTIRKALSIMRGEVPVKSGRLKESIQVKEKSKHGVRDRRYKVEVGPTAFYAKFVEKGTRPSPGKFVPAIEKRVKVGMHPGIASNPFVDRTYQKLRDQLNFGKLHSQIRSAFRKRIR